MEKERIIELHDDIEERKLRSIYGPLCEVHKQDENALSQT